MASPSSVLTFGFGSWGSVNLLPTLGYGIGESIIAAADYSLTLSISRNPVLTLNISRSQELALKITRNPEIVLEK